MMMKLSGIALACFLLALEARGSTIALQPTALRNNNPEFGICRPSEKGYYAQDPLDCQAYYVCNSDGNEFRRSCAPQFYKVLNDKLGECRPLEETDCGLRQVPETKIDDDTWRTDGNCAGQADGKYNVPNQCRKILTCQDGRAFRTNCPANLVFDELINTPGQEACEYVENAQRTDCNQQNAEGGAFGDLKAYSTIESWMNQLDCAGLPDGKHAIQNHCGVYFYCLQGKNLGTQQCPVGLAFENRNGLDGDCFLGEDISRSDCAEKNYCAKEGAGNHYTRQYACDRYMHCNSERGIVQPLQCPVGTVFEHIDAHNVYGCVQPNLSKRIECTHL